MAVQNSLVKKETQVTVADFIKNMQGDFAKALPKVMTPERFTRIALTALSNNIELRKCTATSLVGGLMQAAQLGLEPNTPLGQAYLIPYKNKGVLECQFQVGYKGMLDLAYRSGDIQTIQAYIVHENDKFVYELGLNPKLEHIPSMQNRGNVIYVYAMFKLVNGGYGFEVMSIDDVKAHSKKYSKSADSAYSPWTNNFEEMAKKTVIKKVLKYAPIKTEFALALAADEATVKANNDATLPLIVDYQTNDDSENDTNNSNQDHTDSPQEQLPKNVESVNESEGQESLI